MMKFLHVRESAPSGTDAAGHTSAQALAPSFLWIYTGSSTFVMLLIRRTVVPGFFVMTSGISFFQGSSRGTRGSVVR
jgi:hypothetical protein